MGRYTCAYNCESSSDSDVKCFKFPLYNPRKLKKWLDNMRWKDWTPSRFSVLCINHFEEKYIDRTGKSVTLSEDAVPTLFSSPDDTRTRKASSIKSRGKRNKPYEKVTQPDPAPSPAPSPAPPPALSPAPPPVASLPLSLPPSLPPPPATAKTNVQNKDGRQTEDESAGDKESQKSDKWRIIVDEGLMRIESFPHFFHGDYCLPQDIQWAPDDNVNTECRDPENVIEVKEPWQWLGLDVRGALPETTNGNKYILTVTDYYSKWVEAVPMQSCLPLRLAKHIADIIAHFGYPLGILSRLPHHIVHKINRELKAHLKLTSALVVHHQQTGSADSVTQQLINRMVGDLIEEHAADWDVFLPAKVFSLCFKEHAKTKERPFSLLCCGGLEPAHSPRGQDYVHSKIQESDFVVR